MNYSNEAYDQLLKTYLPICRDLFLSDLLVNKGKKEKLTNPKKRKKEKNTPFNKTEKIILVKRYDHMSMSMFHLYLGYFLKRFFHE